MSTQPLDETKSAIAAVQLEISAANEERKVAKERLEKAIMEGKPTAPFEKLLESATAELTALRQEKTALILSKQPALPRGVSNGMFCFLTHRFNSL